MSMCRYIFTRSSRGRVKRVQFWLSWIGVSGSGGLGREEGGADGCFMGRGWESSSISPLRVSRDSI